MLLCSKTGLTIAGNFSHLAPSSFSKIRPAGTGTRPRIIASRARALSQLNSSTRDDAPLKVNPSSSSCRATSGSECSTPGRASHQLKTTKSSGA